VHRGEDDGGHPHESIGEFFGVERALALHHPGVEHCGSTAGQKGGDVFDRVWVELVIGHPLDEPLVDRQDQAGQRLVQGEGTRTRQHRPVELPVLGEVPGHRQRPRACRHWVWRTDQSRHELGLGNLERGFQQQRVTVTELLVHELPADVCGLGDVGDRDRRRTPLGDQGDRSADQSRPRAAHPAVLGGRALGLVSYHVKIMDTCQ
jgi:hypothetical protein